MSLLDTLDPILKGAAQQLFDVAVLAGVNPRVTSAFRTYAKQKSLYEAYIQGRSKYPAAPPGRSAHEYGLAFDMVVDGASNQVDCGILWNSWGGDYGGEEDPIHFQYPGFSPETYAPGPHPPDPNTTVVTVPVYTAGTLEVKSRQLADKIWPEILGKLGYNVGIEAIAYAIAEIAVEVGGLDRPTALGFVDWGLNHPYTFAQTYFDLIRGIILSY